MNKFGDLTFNEAVTAANLLNGTTGIKAVLGTKKSETVKYGRMTFGKNEALYNILGGEEIVEAILRGEKEINLTDAIIKWFDKHGRRIPPRILQAAVTDANRSFYLKQPKLNYAELLARIVDCFALKEAISADEFENRAETILEGLRADENTQLITNGVHLPFYLPQTQVADYGKVLDEVFLPAVERSYKVDFPKRSFNNYRSGTLANQTTIVEGSRHEQLVEAMRQGNVVGIYSPNCLQGFSVHADREQMTSLPDKFLLAGGFDAAASMVAHPKTLARDSNTPLLDLAAMQWQSSGNSLCFNAHGDNLSFGHRGDLGSADGLCAGGLSVIG